MHSSPAPCSPPPARRSRPRSCPTCSATPSTPTTPAARPKSSTSPAPAACSQRSTGGEGAWGATPELRELFTYSGEIAAPWPTAVTRFERVPGQADLVETVTSSYVRDALGRPVETRSSDGTLTSFTYDRSGGVLSTTTGAGETTRYRYDGHGRMVEVIRPPGRGSTRYAYDLDGRLLSQVESTGSDPWVTSHSLRHRGPGDPHRPPRRHLRDLHLQPRLHGRHLDHPRRGHRHHHL